MAQTVSSHLIRKNGLLIAFVVFLIAVAFSAPSFMTPGNVLDVIRQVSITGMIAIGVTFVVITGRLDLSVGSMLTLLTVMVVDFITKSVRQRRF